MNIETADDLWFGTGLMVIIGLFIGTMLFFDFLLGFFSLLGFIFAFGYIHKEPKKDAKSLNTQ